MAKTATPTQRHFEVHLTAQDGTKNWRRMTVQAEDEDEARFLVETKERAIVKHELNGDPEADDYADSDLAKHLAIEADAKDNDEPVPAATFSALHGHRQAKPYKVTSVTEVPVR